MKTPSKSYAITNFWSVYVEVRHTSRTKVQDFMFVDVGNMRVVGRCV